MLEKQGIKLDVSAAEEFLSAGAVDKQATRVQEVAEELENGTGPGSEYLGWLDLPSTITSDSLAAMTANGGRASQAEVYVVVGIGGSYLGALAILNALGGSADGRPEVIFAGTGLCSSALDRVLQKINDRDFRVCVISKSGTTLEPALAFRILRAELERR